MPVVLGQRISPIINNSSIIIYQFIVLYIIIKRRGAITVGPFHAIKALACLVCRNEQQRKPHAGVNMLSEHIDNSEGRSRCFVFDKLSGICEILIASKPKRQ